MRQSEVPTSVINFVRRFVPNVATLFISGTLDNNTPPFQADEVRKTFKTSTHLVIENAGHESMLVDTRVQQTMVDYLRGGDVSKTKIALPP